MNLVHRRAPDVLAALFTISGIVHLTRPQMLESLVPRWLPNARVVVYASGIAELFCAGGLFRRLRRSGPASAVLLLAVFPGNVQMALDSTRGRSGRITRLEILTFSRLPLQIPLIWAALQARSSGRITFGPRLNG